MKNRLTPELNDQLIDVIVERHSGFATLFVEIRNVAGALGRVPADATAFAHCRSEAMVMGVLLGSPEEFAPVLPQYDAFWDALGSHMPGAYSNVLLILTASRLFTLNRLTGVWPM